MFAVTRRAARTFAFVLLVPIAGCATVADLNPFQREPEPLPPVQGNVIATSSSRPLAERLGPETPTAPAEQPGAEQGVDPEPATDP